jgi:hypothetical protein
VLVNGRHAMVFNEGDLVEARSHAWLTVGDSAGVGLEAGSVVRFVRGGSVLSFGLEGGGATFASGSGRVNVAGLRWSALLMPGTVASFAMVNGAVVVTVSEGEVEVTVGGRMYRVGPGSPFVFAPAPGDEAPPESAPAGGASGGERPAGEPANSGGPPATQPSHGGLEQGGNPSPPGNNVGGVSDENPNPPGNNAGGNGNANPNPPGNNAGGNGNGNLNPPANNGGGNSNANPNPPGNNAGGNVSGSAASGSGASGGQSASSTLTGGGTHGSGNGPKGK